jgi:hypothetical protein
LTIATSATLSRLEDLSDLSSDNDTAVESLIGLLDEHDEEFVEGDPRLL